MKLLITDAEVEGRRTDVRVADGRVVEIAPSLTATGEDEVIDAGGGALLPGLHDHHLHLHAMAAAADSVECGPPATTDLSALEAALRTADATLPAGEWIRGVGYHELVAGDLDRAALDRIVANRPIRIQHRGGGLWMINSVGLAALGLIGSDGRLWRDDARVRDLRGATFPDLTATGKRLADLGITGVTDASPDLEPAAVAHLREASVGDALPQRVVLLGEADCDEPSDGWRPPRKVLLPDHDLPSFDAVVESIRAAHAADRGVAVHCVTRGALLLTLAALDAAGHRRDDRIEHAAVVPVEARARLAAERIAVVTQPVFVADRGDSYLTDVDADDRALLYPYASLLAAGVAVAPSSDAPYGDPDPWRAMAAAAERRTASGALLGAPERVPAETVLAGYLSPPEDPGGPPRRIAVGSPGDLCLLHVPLQQALRALSRDQVRAVFTDQSNRFSRNAQ